MTSTRRALPAAIGQGHLPPSEHFYGGQMPLAKHSVRGTSFARFAKASAPDGRHVVRLGLRFVTSCTPEANDVPSSRCGRYATSSVEVAWALHKHCKAVREPCKALQTPLEALGEARRALREACNALRRPRQALSEP